MGEDSDRPGLPQEAGGKSEGRRRFWLRYFISRLRICKIAHGLHHRVIPRQEIRTGNSIQGLSNPSLQHMFGRLPHTLGSLENSSSSKWQKWKQHTTLQTVNFLFLSHSMAIPGVLLLLTVTSFLLSDCLKSRHYFHKSSSILSIERLCPIYWWRKGRNRGGLP